MFHSHWGDVMKCNAILPSLLVFSLVLQGCSSKPREFAPELAAPPASQTEFDTTLAECQQLLVAGKLDANGRTASAAAGAGAAVGTAALGGTAAVAAGGYGGLAVAGATIVLLPFALLGGAWGMSRMKRAKKERAIKTALEGCLHDRGYDVAGWSKPLKKPVVAPAGTAGQVAR